MVLDAAHIIPSAFGGNEVIENGLILRADLHRLYDAGAFRIDPTGRVVEVRNDLPHYYQTLLADKVLPEDTVRRVAEALELQWASASIAK